MKKSLLVKLHLYCGLFTFLYLISFGFSSLMLNHGIQVAATEITESWEEKVEVDANLPDKEAAEKIRDGLGLMGWVPPWKYQRDSLSLHFDITHPGMVYHAHHNFETHRTRIDKSPKGFLNVLNAMHFFNGKIPNAPLLIRSFAIYQWLGLFVLLISLIFGIWLWLKFSAKKWEVIAFVLLFVGSTIVMSII